jgi:hypothetical protein
MTWHLFQINAVLNNASLPWLRRLFSDVFRSLKRPLRNTAGIGGLAKHGGFSNVERDTMGTYGIQPIIFVGTQ